MITKILIILLTICCIIVILDMIRERRIKVQAIDFTKGPFKKVPTEREELEKCKEEFKEFESPTSEKNQIEEYYDLIQAATNLLQIRGYSKNDIVKGQYLHHEKMRKRGYKML